jgi:hypothetical protein
MMSLHSDPNKSLPWRSGHKELAFIIIVLIVKYVDIKKKDDIK